VVAGVFVFLLSALLNAAIDWGWTSVGRRTVNDLSRALFVSFEKRSLMYHSSHPVGDAISRVMVDSWCVYQYLHAVVFTSLQALFTTAAMIVLMSLLQPTLTIVALVLVPLMMFASFVLGKKLRLAAKDKRAI